MSRWLVTGAGGMLGHDLVALLRGEGAEAVTLRHGELDISDASAVRWAFKSHRPDVVVNCAAWTAVDDAEAYQPEAMRINGDAVAYLADACGSTGAQLLHVSSDYVFAGDADQPYAEDAPPAPRTAYGRTKLAGEQAVLDALPETGYVVRTAWLYGEHGPNFVRTMIRLEGERDTLDVVDDQRGQPTWTRDLAERMVELARSSATPGIYHATSEGETTWYGLAREVFRLLGADPERVRATTTDRMPRPAPRPAYSVLGHERWGEAGLSPIRDWRASLHEAFPALLALQRPDVTQAPPI